MAEQVLLEFNSARMKFFKWYFAAAILALACLAVFFNPGFPIPNALIVHHYIPSLITIVIIAITELRVRSKKYIMTDSRVIERNGILSKEETFLAADRIANYTVKQNFLDRIFGIGSVEIESVDGDDEAEITMEEVANIGKIKEILDRQVSGTRYGARGK